jgi:membrane associated rhomboid family serine protease
MMAFHSFAPHLLEGRNSERTPRLSPGEFLALYTASGVASSLSSSLFFRSIRNNIPALGASGSIFAILTYFCLMHPDAGLLVMFVLPIQASTGLLAVTGVNLALVARAYTAARRGASGPMIDGMAHLGGTAVGALWFWKRRNEERRKAARERSGGGGSRWASSADTSAPPDSDSSTGFVDGFADPFAERSNEGGARGRSGGPGISV